MPGMHRCIRYALQPLLVTLHKGWPWKYVVVCLTDLNAGWQFVTLDMKINLTTRHLLGTEQYIPIQLCYFSSFLWIVFLMPILSSSWSISQENAQPNPWCLAGHASDGTTSRDPLEFTALEHHQPSWSPPQWWSSSQRSYFWPVVLSWPGWSMLRLMLAVILRSLCPVCGFKEVRPQCNKSKIILVLLMPVSSSLNSFHKTWMVPVNRWCLPEQMPQPLEISQAPAPCCK